MESRRTVGLRGRIVGQATDPSDGMKRVDMASQERPEAGRVRRRFWADRGLEIRRGILVPFRSNNV
jgi:hypothetical protein